MTPATAETVIETAATPGKAAHTGASKVASHSIAILVVQIMALGSGLTNNFAIARLGGPEGKGILYSLQLISGVLGLSFLHFCLGWAAVLFLRQKNGTREQIARNVFLPSVVLGAIPAVLMGAIYPWIHNPAAGRLSVMDFWLALLAITAMVLTFNVSLFCLGDDRLGKYNMLMTAQPVLLTVGLLGFVLVRKTSIAVLIGGWGVSVFIPALYSAYFILRAAKGKLLPHFPLFRKMCEFGWRAHLCGALQQLQNRSPVLLVAVMLPVAELGIYSLSISLVELLWYIPQSLSVALLPHVASSSKEEASRVTPAVCRVTLAITAVLGFLVAAGCTVLIPWVLPKFTSGLLPLWILMPGVAFASISRVMASDLNGRNDPMKTFYPVFFALVLETGLGIYFVPKYALLGAAGVTALGYVLNTLLQIPIYCRIAEVPARSILLIQRQDIAGMMRAVRVRIDRLREMVLPELGESPLG